MDHPGGGFATSPWAAVLGHHAAMGHGGEHPGFAGHAHHSTHSHHHGHHGMPMDLHVPQGFPYYRKVGEEAGIQEDWTKLKKKWANIMCKYKLIIEPPTRIGTEDDGPGPLTWPYFDIIHEYASSRHNISPPFIVDTGSSPKAATQVSASHSHNSMAQSPSQSEASTPHSEASTSHSEASTSHSEGLTSRRSSRSSLQGSRNKDAKLMRTVTKIFIKYMTVTHQLTIDSSSDSNED